MKPQTNKERIALLENKVIVLEERLNDCIRILDDHIYTYMMESVKSLETQHYFNNREEEYYDDI